MPGLRACRAAMPETRTTLIRVVAPHFVAGLEIEAGRCVRAAPILRWAIGRTEAELWRYFRRKGWQAEAIE